MSQHRSLCFQHRQLSSCRTKSLQLSEGYKCPSCLTSKSKNVLCENKETETSDSLLGRTQMDFSSNGFEDNNTTVNMSSENYQDGDKNCEPFDKMCPICGEKYQKDTTFADFQTHVENHFVGENEADSIDNIDTVPNSYNGM